MLDFHSHILPGLDDGAPDMDAAIQMARIAVEDGITTMVATPHYIEGSMENSKELILEKLSKYQEVLKNEGINLNVFPGCEVYLSPNIPGLLQKGELMTVNDGGKYILIEFPMQHLPGYVEEVLFEIKLMGVTPIIAHPERNLELAKKPDRVLDLVQKGYLMQVNSGSLNDLYGKKVRKTAELLARNGLVHLLGSDAHSSGGRGPRVRAALMKLGKLDIRNREMIKCFSSEIIEGRPVNPETPSKTIIQTSSLWKMIEKMWRA